MRRRQSTFIRVLIGIVIICAGLGGCGKQTAGDVFDAESEETSVSGDALKEEADAPGDALKEEGTGELGGGAEEESDRAGQEEDDAGEAGVLRVYVCGMVKNPGVYALVEGSRVVDAIGIAGGMTAGAAETYLNQAALLQDGVKIYVPSKEEADALASSTGGNPDSAASEEEGLSSGEKVNLNTATKEELMTLSGIGESKAESILKYRRQQGAFRRIDEVKNVSGIGDGIFDRIKDRITI